MTATTSQIDQAFGKYPFLVAVIPLLSCLWSEASAYQWENNYGTDLSVEYDDNFRLDTTDEIDTTSSNLGVFADIEGTTEISMIRFAIDANSENYSESSIDDETSYNLLLDTSRTGERFSSYLNVELENQPTTESELLDTGVIEDGTRDSTSIVPGLSYQVDERNSFSANLSLEDVSYDTVSLTEYTDNSVSLSWNYGLDETSSISTSIYSSVYEPDQGDDTDINSLSVGYEYRSSEVTTYNFSIGHSEVDRPSGSEDGNDYAFDVNYRTDERNSFTLGLSNSYESSGSGNVREEDRLDMLWNHGLSDKSQFTLSAEAVNTDERDYYSIEIGGNYRYTRDIGLSARYRYREQDQDTGKADSSIVSFSLSYSPL